MMKIFRITWHSIGKYIFTIGCIVQVVVGTLWGIRNIGQIPRYGDTSSYIAVSKTLSTPTEVQTVGYPLRNTGIAYPLLIRGMRMLSASYFHVLVYLCQIGLFCGAVIYFLKTLLNFLDGAGESLKPYIRSYWYLVFVWSMLTNPLLLHFHLTLMTDSLAMSFALIFLTTLLIVFSTVESRGFSLTILAISFLGMSLLRIEKLYFGIATFGVTLLLWLWGHRTQVGFLQIFKKVSVLVIIMGTIAVCIVGFNHQTQAPEFGRPSNLSLRAFEYVTFGRLAAIYPQLPDAVHQRVSYQDAQKFDRLHPNQKNRFLFPKIAHVPNSSQVTWPAMKSTINDITRITFRAYWPEVLLQIGKRFLEYLCSWGTFVWEWLTSSPSPGGTDWTISRMAMYSERLTKAFLNVASVVFILQIVSIMMFHRKFIRRIVSPFTPLFVGSIINSAFFSLFWPVGWMIRYSFVSFVTIVLFLSIGNLLGFIVSEEEVAL